METHELNMAHLGVKAIRNISYAKYLHHSDKHREKIVDSVVGQRGTQVTPTWRRLASRHVRSTIPYVTKTLALLCNGSIYALSYRLNKYVERIMTHLKP